MNSRLLLLGGGAREHALAWKLAQSQAVARIFVAAGKDLAWDESKIEPIPQAPADFPALIDFARDHDVEFVVIGPEDPLAAGAVDAFAAAGIPAFGPTAAAARLEASKVFAREFMDRHGIPGPRWRSFDDFPAAVDFLHSADFDPVIKASGLAAGKGVIVPESRAEAEQALHRMLVEGRFGRAGSEVVVEERLRGQEVSVLAFCDGERHALMPLARDHKPVFDGDRGPNTGGMGVYAPAPLLSPEQLAYVEEAILSPTLAGLAAEGTPYRGVLYAGLMLTAAGPRVLEFNCRFGDPETEAILPLLDGDLWPILRACAAGQLEPGRVRWSDRAAACVIAASPGYPGAYPRGLPIFGLDSAALLPDVILFHAGVRRPEQGVPVTAGGRVLAVTAVAPDLPLALARAYEAIDAIHFEGMHYRRDIGAREDE